MNRAQGSLAALLLMAGLAPSQLVAQCDYTVKCYDSDGCGYLPGGLVKCPMEADDCDPDEYKDTAIDSKGDWLKNVGSGFVPDKRPGWYISLYRGIRSDHNPCGINGFWQDCDDDGYIDATADGSPYGCTQSSYNASWDNNGVPDCMDVLLLHMENAYTMYGFRRFILNRPSGVPCANGSFIPSSVYWTLPAWKRDAIQGALADWIADKRKTDETLEVGIYVNTHLYNTNKTDDDGCVCQHINVNPSPDFGEGGAVAPDTESLFEMNVCRQNWQPWIDAGINAIWLDLTSGSETYLNCQSTIYWNDTTNAYWLSFQQSPNYYGVVKFGYETWPLDYAGCDLTPPVSAGYGVPDPVSSQQGKFIQTDQLFEHWAQGTGIDPLGTWPSEWDTLAPDMEFNIILTNGDGGVYPASCAVLDAYKRHGINPWYAYTSDKHIGYIHRVYDFGTICQADFNGDGCVTIDDVNEAIAQISTYMSLGTTYYEGDIDDNGVITSADASLIVTLYFLVEPSCSGTPCSCNCGSYMKTLTPDP